MSEMKKKKWKLQPPNEKTRTESRSSDIPPSPEPRRTLHQIPRLLGTLRRRVRRQSVASEDTASHTGCHHAGHEDLVAGGKYLGVPVLEAGMLPSREAWQRLRGGGADLHRVRLAHSLLTARTHHHARTALREVDVLTEIRHTNIHLLMGLLHTERCHIVMVFEDILDSIYNLIHEKKVTFTSELKKSFMTQLCEVMIFLHDNGWLHTAVSSHNILVTKNYVLKLSGFEYAQNIYKKYIFTETEAAQRMERYQWLAPEQLVNSAGSCKASDVFSAGLFFWELHAGEIPWLNLSAKQLTMQYLDGNCSCLLENSKISPVLKNILVGCLEPKVQMRKTNFVNILENVSRIQKVPNRKEDKPAAQNQSDMAVRRVRASLQPLPYSSTPAEIYINSVNTPATKRQYEHSDHGKQTLKLKTQRLENNPHNYENELNTVSQNHICQNSKDSIVLRHLNSPGKGNMHSNFKRKDVSLDKTAKCNMLSKKKINDFIHPDKINVNIGADKQNLLHTVEEMKNMKNNNFDSANSGNFKSEKNLDKTTNFICQERLGLLTSIKSCDYQITQMEKNIGTPVLHSGELKSKDSKGDVCQKATSNNFVEDLEWNNKIKNLQTTTKTRIKDNFISKRSAAKSESHGIALSKIQLLAFAIDIYVKKWEYEGKPMKNAINNAPELCIYNRIVRAVKRVSECYPHLFDIKNASDHCRDSSLNNTNALSLNQYEICLPKSTNGISSSTALYKAIHGKQKNKEMESTLLKDEETMKELPRLTSASSSNQNVGGRSTSNQPLILISSSNRNHQTLKISEENLVCVNSQNPMGPPTDLNVINPEKNGASQLKSLINCSMDKSVTEILTQSVNKISQVPTEVVATEDLYFDDDFGSSLDSNMELLVFQASSTQSYNHRQDEHNYGNNITP